MFLSSCATTTVVETKYVVSTPVKIDRPAKPEFQTLDSKKPITDKDNFKKLQINISLLNSTLGMGHGKAICQVQGSNTDNCR